MKIAVTLKQSYDIDVLLDLETSINLWQTSYSEERQKNPTLLAQLTINRFGTNRQRTLRLLDWMGLEYN